MEPAPFSRFVSLLLVVDSFSRSGDFLTDRAVTTASRSAAILFDGADPLRVLDIKEFAKLEFGATEHALTFRAQSSARPVEIKIEHRHR